MRCVPLRMARVDHVDREALSDRRGDQISGALGSVNRAGVTRKNFFLSRQTSKSRSKIKCNQTAENVLRLFQPIVAKLKGMLKCR